MALQRKWTQEAKDNIISILDYLLEHWTERDAKNFLIKLERIIALIEKGPLLYPRSRKTFIVQWLPNKSLYTIPLKANTYISCNFLAISKTLENEKVSGGQYNPY